MLAKLSLLVEEHKRGWAGDIDGETLNWPPTGCRRPEPLLTTMSAFSM
jgi:hypothetical protein